jgi:hypothetical protein
MQRSAAECINKVCTSRKVKRVLCSYLRIILRSLSFDASTPAGLSSALSTSGVSSSAAIAATAAVGTISDVADAAAAAMVAAPVVTDSIRVAASVAA